MADQIGATPLAMPVTPFELNPVLLRVNTGGTFFYACIPYASDLTQNEKTHQTVVVGATRFDFPMRKPSQLGFLHG